MTKPHIRPFQGVWQCKGLGAVGYGRTPSAAWTNWRSRLRDPAACFYDLQLAKP